MGCCFSAGKRRPEAERGSSVDGAPPTSPPGVFEEEAVKEVLMETPIVAKNEDRVDAGMGAANREIESAAAAAAVDGNSALLKEERDEIAAEGSEISEICSYSDSLSNAAAQGRRKEEEGEEDGVVNQRPPPRKRRAHGGGRGRGGRRVAAPPSEKRVQVAPPTEKRVQVAPPTEKRVQVAPPPEKRVQVAPPVRGRSVAEENGGKRDAGDVPVKRWKSMSPEAEARRNAGGEKISIPVPATAEFGNGGGSSAEEAETLESPVVSLECFIFL